MRNLSASTSRPNRPAALVAVHRLLAWLVLTALLAGLLGPAAPAAATPVPPASSGATPDGLSAQEWAAVQSQIGQGAAGLANVTANEDAQLFALGNPNDRFGLKVAVDGDWLVVGAPYVDEGGNTDQGMAYVFTRNDSNAAWRLHQNLEPPVDLSQSYDRFGDAVAIDGDTILIGAPLTTRQGTRYLGTAYLFLLGDNNKWTLQEELHNPARPPLPDTFYGQAVALHANTILIGAPGENNNQGAVYAFQRNGQPVSRLSAAAPAAGDFFGSAVALGNERYAVIGAPGRTVAGQAYRGAAYVFVQPGGQPWSQAALLTADEENAANDEFGSVVAAYGTVMLVGAPFHANSRGAVYVFDYSGTTWTQQQKLSGAEGDRFGSALAFQEGTVVIGAPGAAGDQGSVYVFTRIGASLDLQARLTTSGGRAADTFGRAVALDGATLAAGAPGTDITYQDQGAAVVFAYNKGAWGERQTLTAQSSERDRFGAAVALDGDTLLVGAPDHDVDGKNNQGAAYVFTRSGDGWRMAQKLTASTGRADDRFGRAVALDGDTLLVGAAGAEAPVVPGAAYVFVFDGDAWREQTKLTAQGTYAFGQAVALEGSNALVGARGTTANRQVKPDQGVVYSFTYAGAEWTQQQALFDPEGDGDDFFGSAVALDGSTALIGARGADINGRQEQGAAYVFTRDGGIWREQQRLLDAEGNADDFFGRAVALDGSTALIGKGGFFRNQSAAHIFTYDGTEWTQQQRIPTPASGIGGSAGSFGTAVALAGDIALVGASHAVIDGNGNQGAAYLFRRTGATWNLAQELSIRGGVNLLFGSGVALDGNTALVGAPGADVYGSKVGAAHVYTLARSAEVLSITRAGASPTSAATVAFTVTFDMDVSGVSADNFALTTTGKLPGAGIVGVSGSGASWRVEVATGAGSGALRLDLTSAAGITPMLANAPYTNGESYTIEPDVPENPGAPDQPSRHFVYLPLMQR